MQTIKYVNRGTRRGRLLRGPAQEAYGLTTLKRKRKEAYADAGRLSSKDLTGRGGGPRRYRPEILRGYAGDPRGHCPVFRTGFVRLSGGPFPRAARNDDTGAQSFCPVFRASLPAVPLWCIAARRSDHQPDCHRRHTGHRGHSGVCDDRTDAVERADEGCRTGRTDGRLAEHRLHGRAAAGCIARTGGRRSGDHDIAGGSVLHQLALYRARAVESGRCC